MAGHPVDAGVRREPHPAPDRGVTFESSNIPGAYLRHFESAVCISAGNGTGFNRPQALSADSSWNLAAPWAP